MGVPIGHVDGCQVRFELQRRGLLLLCCLLAFWVVPLGSVHASAGPGGEATPGMPAAAGGHETAKEPPTLNPSLVPPGSAAKELESLKSGEELPVPHEAAAEAHGPKQIPIVSFNSGEQNIFLSILIGLSN